MNSFINKIYLIIRKKEIFKAKIKLKKVKTDLVLKVLTKICWNCGIQYEIIIKRYDVLILKLTGKKENIIFKYHKTDMVFMEDYQRFLNYIDEYSAQKGVYITTGVFENKILSDLNHFIFNDKVKLVDCISFIRYQLGLFNDTYKAFTKDTLKFYRYLPD